MVSSGSNLMAHIKPKVIRQGFMIHNMQTARTPTAGGAYTPTKTADLAIVLLCQCRTQFLET